MISIEVVVEIVRALVSSGRFIARRIGSVLLRVPLEEILGLNAFSLDRVLEVEPDFLDSDHDHEHDDDEDGYHSERNFGRKRGSKMQQQHSKTPQRATPTLESQKPIKTQCSGVLRNYVKPQTSSRHGMRWVEL